MNDERSSLITHHSSLNKKYLLLGHLCFLVLLVLAAKYANVRVLLTDSAYQLFYDINHDGMLINDSRYSMVFSQILPWIAIHLHLPLKLVVVSYSVSFVLVGYACWLLTAYLMKQRQAATLMLFVLLAIGGTFLHCISESFQLMFYVPMLYAWMCQGERFAPVESQACKAGRKVKGEMAGASNTFHLSPFTYYLVLALLVALAFFIYPMSVFYILFAVGFRLFEEGNAFHLTLNTKHLTLNKPAMATVALLVAYIVLYGLIGASGHDSEFIPTGEGVRNSLLHFFSLGSFHTFKDLFFELYWVPTVLLVLTLVGYVRGKQWWKFWFVGGYAVAYLVASCIIYQEGDSLISRERYFIPFFFITGLPFLIDELPRFSKWQSRIFFCVFVVLIGCSFVRILKYVHIYEPRLEAITKVSKMAEEQGVHKIIVTESTAKEVFPHDLWGLALESMLFTAQQGPEHTVTIYKEKDDFNRSDADLYLNPEVYVSVNWWKRWEVKDLNPHYFSLPAQGYKELKKDENGYHIVDL